MTELDLAAIRERAERATHAPWWAWDRGAGWEIGVGTDVDGRGRPEQVLPEGQRTDIGRREDAEFIAAARTDVPLLVAELERLQRLLGDAPVPTVDAYENVVQALSDERAEVVRLCDLLLARGQEREDLRGLLAEILHKFPVPPPEQAGTYEPVRSDPVPVVALERWRSHLGGMS